MGSKFQNFPKINEESHNRVTRTGRRGPQVLRFWRKWRPYDLRFGREKLGGIFWKIVKISEFLKRRASCKNYVVHLDPTNLPYESSRFSESANSSYDFLKVGLRTPKMVGYKKDDSGIDVYFLQNSFTLCVCGVVAVYSSLRYRAITGDIQR